MSVGSTNEPRTRTTSRRVWSVGIAVAGSLLAGVTNGALADSRWDRHDRDSRHYQADRDAERGRLRSIGRRLLRRRHPSLCRQAHGQRRQRDAGPETLRFQGHNSVDYATFTERRRDGRLLVF